MTPYEVMLSESQERMLVVVAQGHEAQVAGRLRPLGPALRRHRPRHRRRHRARARRRAGGGRGARARSSPTTAAATAAGGAPPAYLDDVAARIDLADLAPIDAGPATHAGTASAAAARARPNIASKRWSTASTTTWCRPTRSIPPGAATPRCCASRARDKAIALSPPTATAATATWTRCAGGAIAVAEAARNVACTGARPIGGHRLPELRQPREAGGLLPARRRRSRAWPRPAERSATPVISGNVSLYNETPGEPIYPTPVIGMLGLLEDVRQAVHVWAFKDEGDVIVLIGDHELYQNPQTACPE